MESTLNQTEEMVMTKEEAIELALEYERVSSARSQIKKQLEKYVEQNGKLDFGPKVWDFYETEKWVVEGEGLKDLAGNLVMDGKNPWDILSITPGEIKKLNYPDEILEKFGTKKKGYPFKSLKAKK